MILSVPPTKKHSNRMICKQDKVTSRRTSKTFRVIKQKHRKVSQGQIISSLRINLELLSDNRRYRQIARCSGKVFQTMRYLLNTISNSRYTSKGNTSIVKGNLRRYSLELGFKNHQGKRYYPSNSFLLSPIIL